MKFLNIDLIIRCYIWLWHNPIWVTNSKIFLSFWFKQFNLFISSRYFSSHHLVDLTRNEFLVLFVSISPLPFSGDIRHCIEIVMLSQGPFCCKWFYFQHSFGTIFRNNKKLDCPWGGWFSLYPWVLQKKRMERNLWSCESRQETWYGRDRRGVACIVRQPRTISLITLLSRELSPEEEKVKSRDSSFVQRLLKCLCVFVLSSTLLGFISEFSAVCD